MINLHHIDCMEFMRGLPDKAYDLAIVDPPYGIGASGSFGHYWNSTAGKPAKSGLRNVSKQWDTAIPGSEYWSELIRVSRDQIVWGGNYFTEHLPPSRGWIGWDKKQPEAASFAMLELAWTSFDCVINMFRMWSSHVTQGERIHPTQKPVALYRWILHNYAKPGQKILDTHGGSMSIAIACDIEGFDLDLCELDKDYFEAGKKRLEAHQAQPRMFDAPKAQPAQQLTLE